MVCQPDLGDNNRISKPVLLQNEANPAFAGTRTGRRPCKAASELLSLRKGRSVAVTTRGLQLAGRTRIQAGARKGFNHHVGGSRGSKRTRACTSSRAARLYLA